jgi:hypothetical protein
VGTAKHGAGRMSPHASLLRCTLLPVPPLPQALRSLGLGRVRCRLARCPGDRHVEDDLLDLRIGVADVLPGELDVCPAVTTAQKAELLQRDIPGGGELDFARELGCSRRAPPTSITKSDEAWPFGGRCPRATAYGVKSPLSGGGPTLARVTPHRGRGARWTFFLATRLTSDHPPGGRPNVIWCRARGGSAPHPTVPGGWGAVCRDSDQGRPRVKFLAIPGHARPFRLSVRTRPRRAPSDRA